MELWEVRGSAAAAAAASSSGGGGGSLPLTGLAARIAVVDNSLGHVHAVGQQEIRMRLQVDSLFPVQVLLN
jgi:hypothetical protein